MKKMILFGFFVLFMVPILGAEELATQISITTSDGKVNWNVDEGKLKDYIRSGTIYERKDITNLQDASHLESDSRITRMEFTVNNKNMRVYYPSKDNVGLI